MSYASVMLAVAATASHVAFTGTVTVVHLLVMQREVPAAGKLVKKAFRLLSASSQLVPTPWLLDMVWQSSDAWMV